ncbi:MAG: hypothetical protein Kow0081_2940 [Candidatus Dojkabacteria bacterium]
MESIKLLETFGRINKGSSEDLIPRAIEAEMKKLEQNKPQDYDQFISDLLESTFKKDSEICPNMPANLLIKIAVVHATISAKDAESHRPSTGEDK